jgi:hypothetical protein
VILLMWQCQRERTLRSEFFTLATAMASARRQASGAHGGCSSREMNLDECAGDGAVRKRAIAGASHRVTDEMDVGSASPLLVVHLSAGWIGIRKVRISPVDVSKASRKGVASVTHACDRSSLVNLGGTTPSE